MTKNELKTGMKVTYRNGKVRYVVKDTPFGDGLTDVNARVWASLTTYADDLTENTNHDEDIMKVETPVNKFRVLGGGKDTDYDVVWERNEVRRITLDELRAIIGEFTIIG